MPRNITLRPMRPEDGPALRELHRHTPDTGAISFSAQFHGDPYAILHGMHPHTRGVVAEVPGYAGLVGLCLVSVGTSQYEGDVRRSAYLNTLSVHPDYRRQGIAQALTRHLLTRVEAEMGSDAVVYAAIQTGNIPSLKAAAHWRTQTLAQCTQVCAIPLRARPPAPLPGLEVRPAGHDELEECAARQNSFYTTHNFYEPQTASGLDAWRSVILCDQRRGEYYVAVSRSGRVVAGLGVVQYGAFISNRVVRMPLAVRAANVLLKAVPPDRVMRRLQVQQFWFAPDQVAAGRYLWESVRWLSRTRGTTLVAFYDPRSPITQAIVRPRFVPTTSGALVVRASTPARPDRPVYWAG